MSELNQKHLNDLDITNDEIDRLSLAFKDNEFKKLFFNYCQELQDPENRKIFEKEIIELEAERGVKVIFLNPIPGFVVKTSVNGVSKGFINIAISDQIDKPKNEIKFNKNTGKNGLSWSIPYAQAPSSRYDYDNRKEKCLVYDVLFHSDALKLANNNNELRKHIISIACDAVEREFNVKLDQTNLKYPKMKFKGIPRPTVIRKIIDCNKDFETSPLDEYMPPKPNSTEFPKPKIHECTNNDQKPDDYTKPKYIIKYRRDIDLSEMTNELDAKLNLTIPTDIIIEIELPLLKSTSDCILDVTETKLYLISEKPAKYQLNIKLPYHVNDKNGTAKFQFNIRKLIVTLPIIKNKANKIIKDLLLYREDSGIENDIKDDEQLSSTEEDSSSPYNNNKQLIEILNTTTELLNNNNDDDDDDNDDDVNDDDDNDDDDNDNISQINNNDDFLLDTIEYNYPSNFNCNILNDNLCFLINIKNVDPNSLKNYKTNNSIHIKFISIGSGYYPINYSFYCQLDINSNANIIDAITEIWDNNVILTLNLSNYNNLKYYSTGLNQYNTEIHEIYENFKHYNEIINKDIINNNNNNNDDVNISINKNSDDNSVEINIDPIEENHNNENIDNKNNDNNIKTNNKKHKKKNNNKKYRSYSESACYDIKLNDINKKSQSYNEKRSMNNKSDNNNISTDNNNGALRKIRSFSESRSDQQHYNNTSIPSYKGILKHYSRYDHHCYSDSYSSMDEQYSCSADMILRQADSFDDIPEEDCNKDNCGGDDDGHSLLSESCKKTVRFSPVIHKQLFRLDSSILGQKKKNQKRKNQKQRAIQRRNSEGDSFDYDDDKHNSLRKDAPNHDSGVDLAELNKSALKSRDLNDSELSEDNIYNENKNNYMFHMEM